MYRNLRRWKIWREFVLVREGCESVEADFSAHLGVSGSGAANDKSLMFRNDLRVSCHQMVNLVHESLRAAMLGMKRGRVNKRSTAAARYCIRAVPWEDRS